MNIDALLIALKNEKMEAVREIMKEVENITMELALGIDGLKIDLKVRNHINKKLNQYFINKYGE